MDLCWFWGIPHLLGYTFVEVQFERVMHKSVQKIVQTPQIFILSNSPMMENANLTACGREVTVFSPRPNRGTTRERLVKKIC